MIITWHLVHESEMQSCSVIVIHASRDPLTYQVTAKIVPSIAHHL